MKNEKKIDVSTILFVAFLMYMMLVSIVADTSLVVGKELIFLILFIYAIPTFLLIAIGFYFGYLYDLQMMGIFTVFSVFISYLTTITIFNSQEYGLFIYYFLLVIVNELIGVIFYRNKEKIALIQDKLSKFTKNKVVKGIKIFCSVLFISFWVYVIYVFISPIGSSSVSKNPELEMYFLDYVFIVLAVLWLFWLILQIYLIIMNFMNRKN